MHLTTIPANLIYCIQLEFQTPAVRKAIHVGNRTYNDGSTVEKHLVQDVMKSVKPWIEALLSDGRYRVMIYNGQLDIIIGWPLTESFVSSMKWKGAKDYLGWPPHNAIQQEN